MKDFSLTPINAKGDQFIQVTEKSFDEIGLGTRNTGFIPVQPEKARAVLAKLKAGELTAEFGDKNRQTSLYEVTVSVSETVIAE